VLLHPDLTGPDVADTEGFRLLLAFREAMGYEQILAEEPSARLRSLLREDPSSVRVRGAIVPEDH
jgi:hypothetical protein